jgi:hypothetical protein
MPEQRLHGGQIGPSLLETLREYWRWMR